MSQGRQVPQRCLPSGKMIVGAGRHRLHHRPRHRTGGLLRRLHDRRRHLGDAGYPDYGLITMTEMVGNASRIATRSRSR